MDARSSARSVLVVAAIGGAGTMVVELAAVRLLAPWFGSSQAVWTNVIGVVLLALAAGYLLGGRLAARGRPLRWLGGGLLLAAAFTAWLPGLAGPVAGSFLPEGVALHEAAGLVLWGSLACSLLLFLPPALVLGTVAPLALEAVQERRGGHAGQAGGLVLSWSTLGSLLGVFGTSHALLPGLGLDGTFLLAASVLAVAGLLALWLERGNGAGGRTLPAVLLLLFASAQVLSRSSRPDLPDGLVELAQAESAYQSVRVVEDRRGEEPLRLLQVNESFDSYQSVWQPEPGLLPRGFYYNDFALPAGWSAAERELQPATAWRVLVLGLGGGTAHRVLAGARPEGMDIEATGIELDPTVLRLGAQHLELPEDSPATRWIAGLDARVALRCVEGAFDQVVLDCYANQVEIPPHLCTAEFFRELLGVLAPGGWLSVNLGGFGFDDPVVATVARTCAAAFGTDVLLLQVPASRNISLFARRDAALPVRGEHAGAGSTLARAMGPADALLGPRELAASWTLIAPPDASSPGAILTDDLCPIEALQQRSIAEGLERLRRGARG